MADKKDILNSWIMVELLSEGDIKPTDKKYIGFDDLKEEDYYSFFQNQLSQRANNVYKNAKNGIAVYLNIFDFQIIVDFLRNKYKLSAPEEEIKYGSKFSLVLYFDKDLNLLNDLTFFTVNGFILSQKRVPDLAEFREYEENQKTKLAQFFGVENSDSEDAKNNGQSLENAKSNEPPRVDPQVFNEAMKKAFSIFDDQIELSDCKVQVINNIESDAVNLHSFFIEDLEKAKTISTENLNKYLLGESLNRINLDSKNDSGSFNPEVLADILQPKNYPLGRFPSNTKYALFFMQQIAVNLSIGYDNNQIRSVNGPPGTGKTTLLKDIFAELIVKQAHDIYRLSNKEIRGTENTKYYNNASIGMIPENIAENSIIVASSNNGAVQNIVDELPLSKGVSESLLPELQAIDYFRDISNSSIESSWSDGVEKLELISKDPNFWGLFSLEGGRSDNMKNILSCMKAVVQSFDNGVYESDPDIYDHFEKQYKAAEEYREGIQKLSVDYRQYIKDKEKYAEARDAFTIDEKTWEEKIELGNVENAQKQSLWEKEKRDLSPKITEIDQLIAEKKENCDKYSELLANLKANKPRPWIFAKNEIKMQYNENLSKAQTGFTHALEEQQDLENQRSAYRKQFNEIDAKMKESAAEQEELKASFAVWKDRQLKGLAELDNKISLGSTVFNEKYNGIKLSSSYNELQLSNPWFDEQYRIIQSKLFIEALKVRKQFLYENRKNIKAATIIWNKQNEYDAGVKTLMQQKAKPRMFLENRIFCRFIYF